MLPEHQRNYAKDDSNKHEHIIQMAPHVATIILLDDLINLLARHNQSNNDASYGLILVLIEPAIGDAEG